MREIRKPSPDTISCFLSSARSRSDNLYKFLHVESIPISRMCLPLHRRKNKQGSHWANAAHFQDLTVECVGCSSKGEHEIHDHRHWPVRSQCVAHYTIVSVPSRHLCGSASP
ncbi:hypothetical protein NPIL_303471 [Nephila pilipes]|uniref:Uncharacterized protein n=1 Tax=Nephila pilipes TaxID=299642 RepID=A0A8X6QFU5_NEPPI|nr:hypothetical protein NPIL_303471 [Nephila pilipes]